MKPIIYVYTEFYYHAKKMFNTLYRPSIDKANLCTKELWENGECLEIERDTETWRIFRLELQESEDDEE